MAVKEKTEYGKLVLTLDNGDLREFNKVMEKWNFKDSQSLLRFAISLLVLNDNKYFSVKINNAHRDVEPTSELLKVAADE